LNINILTNALEQIKNKLETAITTATFNNQKKANGLEAKTSLIRSEQLIQEIHEVVKISLNSALKKAGFNGFSIHPEIGKTSPEKLVWGFLKKKKQDVVVLFNEPNPEKITEGPLIGQIDELGKKTTEKAIVIGVRSQLSSIDKNFDTLMERTFAESMNLHLRHPKLVLGEVYLLIVREYDEQAMKKNQIKFKDKYTDVEKFITIFNGMSHRENFKNLNELYKYESTALLLVDFSQTPVKLYTSLEELKKDGIVSKQFNQNFNSISPIGFSERLIKSYKKRHGI